MRLRWAIVPVAAFAAITLSAAAAFANIVVVDSDGQASQSNCNGSGFAYPTVQQGVAAAQPGDMVRVCGEPAPYTGPVTVGTSGVQLVGVNNPVLQAPGATAVTLAADNTSITGFEIDNSNTGITTDPTHSGYRIQKNNIHDNTIGIFLGSNGAQSSLVNRNTIASNNAAGSASGTGIYSDVPLSNVTITQNTFDNNDNQQINITPITGPDSGLTISKNTFVNGDNSDIAFCPGCGQAVNNSTISNNTITDQAGFTTSSIFIGGDSNGNIVSHNTITNSNCNGIAVRETAHNITLSGNRISGAACSGIDVSSTAAGAVLASGNRIANSADVGIHLSTGTNGNHISGNRATLSGSGFNCVDDNIPSTNVWSGNKYAPSNPPGLCTG